MTIRDVGNFHFFILSFFHFYITQISDIFLQRIARIIRIFRRKRRRWPMQNNPNGRSRRGSKIRIIRAIRCGKTLPNLKLYHFSFK